ATAAMQGGDFNGIADIYDPRTRTGTDPNITSTPFPGNSIPANRIDPISKKLLEFYRQPNLPGTRNNYQQSHGAPINRDQFILRTNTGAPITWGIPSVGFTNWQGLGDDSEGPYENKYNSLQFLNNTSWVRGKHTFRFGGEIRRDQFNQDGNQFARGSFGFEVN